MKSRHASRRPRESHFTSASFGSLMLVGGLFPYWRAKYWLAIAPRLNQTPWVPSNSYSVRTSSLSSSGEPADTDGVSKPGRPYRGGLRNEYAAPGCAQKSQPWEIV